MGRQVSVLSFLAILTVISGAAVRGATSDAVPQDAVAHLHDLFDREWAWRLKESPELATSVGVHDYDDRLSDVSMETLARQTKDSEGFLAELQKIDRNALSAADQHCRGRLSRDVNQDAVDMFRRSCRRRPRFGIILPNFHFMRGLT